MSIEGPAGMVGEDRMGGRQARLLLALLVLERPRAVPRGELADALWPVALPSSWEPALRSVLSRVRAAFALAGFSSAEVLTTAFGCCQLHLPEETVVDVEAAGRAVEAADAALREGDADTAAREAEVAVAVASRPFLVGEDGLWVRRVQMELRARLLRALEALSEARVLQGEPLLAVDAADQAVAADPLRESAHRCLMAAHAAAGNRGDALRAYGRCRQTLAEELGVSPSDETEQAYVRLLGTEPEPHDPPAPAVTATHPFPEALRVVSPFAGRQHELDLLRDSWREAASGHRRVMVVGGDPGVGKTTLAAQFAAEVHSDGATVLYGRCDEQLHAPYEPFGEALGRYLAGCSAQDLRQQLCGLSPDLARIAPDIPRRLPDLVPPPSVEPETDRHRMFAAISALLTVLAERAPVLLVLDDVQWGGTAAMLLLRYLTRTLETSRVMLLITYRHGEGDDSSEAGMTLSDLKREAGVRELLLEGLDVAAVAEVIQVLCAAPPATSQFLASAVWEETGGNALFVTEVVRHLAATTAGCSDEASAKASLARLGPEMPTSLTEVVRRRQAGLSEVAKRVLNVAAVVGRDFEVDIVADVAGLDAEAVLDALDEAATARFVAEVPGAVGQYRFVHGLVHGVVYQGIGSTRRARQHALVAAAIEDAHAGDLTTHVVELCRHYWEARHVGRRAKAADYAVAAGEQAFEQLSFEKAAEYFERALALKVGEPGEDRRRCTTLMALATAHRKAGHIVAARDAYLAAAELARRLGDPEALAGCALGLAGGGRGVSAWISDEVRISLLEEALDAIGEGQEELRARVTAELATVLAYAGRHEKRDVLAGEALETARRVGGGSVLAEALGASRIVLSGPAQTELRLAYGEEMVAVAEEARDPELLVRARLGRLPDLMEQGDPGTVEDEVAATLCLAAEVRQPSYLWQATTWDVVLHVMHGDLGKAERRADEALAIWGRAPHPGARQCHLVHRASMAIAGSCPDEAADVLEHLVAEQPDVACYRCLLAFALAEGGRRPAAAAEFERFAADGFVSPPPEASWLAGMAALSETCAHLGDASRAENLYDLMLPFGSHNVVLEVAGGGGLHLGVLSHHLGVLALTMQRWSEAQQLLDEALAINLKNGATPWAERSRRALAQARSTPEPPPGRGRAASAG